MERQFKQTAMSRKHLDAFINDSEKYRQVVEKGVDGELYNRSEKLAEMTIEQQLQLAEFKSKLIKDTFTDLDNYKPSEFYKFVGKGSRLLIHRGTGAIFTLIVRSLNSWEWYSTSHPQYKGLRSPKDIWDTVKKIEIANRPVVTTNVDKLVEKEYKVFEESRNQIKQDVKQSINKSTEILRSIEDEVRDKAIKDTINHTFLIQDRGDHLEHLPTQAKIRVSVLSIGSCCWYIQQDKLEYSKMVFTIDDLRRELNAISVRLNLRRQSQADKIETAMKFFKGHHKQVSYDEKRDQVTIEFHNGLIIRCSVTDDLVKIAKIDTHQLDDNLVVQALRNL